MSKNISFCPDCGGEVRFKRAPYLGQSLICRQCSVELVVVEKSPIRLDWADSDDDYEYAEWEDTYDDFPEDRSRHNGR